LKPLRNKHVNLISVNPIDQSGQFLKLTERDVEEFAKYLNSLGLNATVRRSMGGDISGSCGQLRNTQSKGSE